MNGGVQTVMESTMRFTIRLRKRLDPRMLYYPRLKNNRDGTINFVLYLMVWHPPAAPNARPPGAGGGAICLHQKKTNISILVSEQSSIRKGMDQQIVIESAGIHAGANEGFLELAKDRDLSVGLFFVRITSAGIQEHLVLRQPEGR